MKTENPLSLFHPGHVLLQSRGEHSGQTHRPRARCTSCRRANRRGRLRRKRRAHISRRADRPLGAVQARGPRHAPRLVWEWYAWRRETVANVAPNPAHHALAAMQTRFPRFTLVTQNVDGLHQRAGSRDIIELHGNITRTKCFEENTVVTEWPRTCDVPPKCPRCGGLLRPDVVWFEESLPEQAIAAALAASRDCDLFLSVGTSTAVYPAASLPFEALHAGAVVAEINPQPTPLTCQADFVFSEPAGVVLPEFLKCLRA